ncbi:MAG: VOC family protein [Pseudomonadales bacterium]|nr:VOC family protein [Pseudomonadales bacterium]
MKVSRLDHAVLRFADVERAKRFYRDVLGMKEVVSAQGMCLLRAGSDEQHHDLGLFPAHHHQRPASGAPGLYHLAWKVDTIEELAEAKTLLEKAGALRGASSHGATKSLYGVDPEGNEFEIVFTIPREDWGHWEHGGTVEPLDIEAELKRYGKSE